MSEHPLATGVGLSILEAGGNAADAAVATAFALAVVFPQAGNLGGGGFAIHVPHDPRGEILALDFRETAPAGLAARDFLEGGRLQVERALESHLAVGVPGSPAGLHHLHRRAGSMSFPRLVRPAIELAREGFPVDPWLARALESPAIRRRLERGRGAAIFYPGGEPLAEGDLLVQEELAGTLERIARSGPEGFYRGPVAESIAAEMASGGGVLGPEDLAAYRPREREPLRGWFRGKEVIAMPPPSSGGIVLLQVLSILNGFPLDQERERTLAAAAARAGVGDEGGGEADAVGLSGRALHWWIEAMRRAFADRAEHMGDPDFHDVPQEELLSPSWIARRRISIGERANPAVGPMPVALPPEGGETTHISVLDSEGNAVSLTTTLNTSFGTGIVVPGAGFLLNNELDDFSIVAGTPNAYGLVGGEANALRPNKRPLSSMTPTVIRDGGNAVTAVLGSPGGPRIISSVIEVILRTTVYGQGMEDAIRSPRLHQQWNPPQTLVEPGWDPLLLQALRDREHRIEEVPSRFGSVQGILLEIGGEPEAFSDPRRGGAAGLEGIGVAGARRPTDAFPIP